MPAKPATLDETAWVKELCDKLVENVENFIHGQTGVVKNAVICLLAEGHLLIEGIPGVAKTSLAKAIAQSIRGSMKRIQFTPDLLPSDVTGAEIYDQRKLEFEFRRGPIFANIVLGDEINRASPKTQSALLEAMGERQVTADRKSHKLPRPNIVIATQNPIDMQGTYALPEAQLDRFMMQLRIDYPSVDDEVKIVAGAIARKLPEALDAVLTIDQLLRMIKITSRIHAEKSIQRYIVDIVTGTRENGDIRLGASPRASNALAMASQARAATYEGREFVTVDDVKAMAAPVLCHRLLLTPEAMRKSHAGRCVGVKNKSHRQCIVEAIVRATPVPS